MQNYKLKDFLFSRMNDHLSEKTLYNPQTRGFRHFCSIHLKNTLENLKSMKSNKMFKDSIYRRTCFSQVKVNR